MKRTIIAAAVIVCQAMGGESQHSNGAASQVAGRENREFLAALRESVGNFLDSDSQAKELLYPSKAAIYDGGYRPDLGGTGDPEEVYGRQKSLREYFIKKVALDMSHLEPLNKVTVRSFIDKVGELSDASIIEMMAIAETYSLNLGGKFVFNNELAKITATADRENFVRLWLTDAILSTELRTLAAFYREMFHEPYITPEKRK